MDKDVAIRKVARKLVMSKQFNINWAELKDLLAAISVADRKDLLAAIQHGQPQAVGQHILRHVGDWARAQAAAEAETMLADDAISLAELDKVL